VETARYQDGTNMIVSVLYQQDGPNWWNVYCPALDISFNTTDITLGRFHMITNMAEALDVSPYDIKVEPTPELDRFHIEKLHFVLLNVEEV